MGFLVVRPGDDLSSEKTGNGIETYFSEDYHPIVFDTSQKKRGVLGC